MITKNYFRAATYFGAAFFTGFTPAAMIADSAKGWVLAVAAGMGAGFLALRAYADQTVSQDGKDPEPVIHG